LVPVIGIVQVGGQAMADRYTYIPLIGIFVMAAWTAPEIFSGFRWSKALLRFSALGVLLAGGALAHNQVKYWHDDISLFNHALAATRRNPMAHCNLGQNYAKQGKFDLAAIQLRAALEESPIFAEARVALAGVLDAQGKAQEALKEIELEVGITPWSGVAHNCLGAILQHLGRGAEARGQFEEAVRLEPDFPDARSNLGGILVLEGKLDEAIAQFSAALALDPRSEKAHFGLASALAGQGKRDKAILEYQTVLWLNPTHWNALNDLAWIRATASDARLRDGRDAVKLAEQACKLTEFREPLFIGTLAAAYAEAGRFDEAIKNAQKARALAYATGRKQLADRNQELLEFYLAGKPHREPPTKSKN
jgi:tetratricopeptide (TPR) repeat protein